MNWQRCYFIGPTAENLLPEHTSKLQLTINKAHIFTQCGFDGQKRGQIHTLPAQPPDKQHSLKTDCALT